MYDLIMACLRPQGMQCVIVITRSNFSQIFTKDIQSSPIRERYWCLLLVQALIDILPQFLQFFMQCLTILQRDIAALDSVWKNKRVGFCMIDQQWHTVMSSVEKCSIFYVMMSLGDYTHLIKRLQVSHITKPTKIVHITSFRSFKNIVTINPSLKPANT